MRGQIAHSLMDDTAMASLNKKRIAQGSKSSQNKRARHVNPLLAIDDLAGNDHHGDEDEDNNDGDDGGVKLAPPKGLTGTIVDEEKSRTWGPLSLQWVWRIVSRGPNKGSYTMQWECNRGKHSDHEDDKTACRKTRTFVDIDDCEVQFQWLKRWLLNGRWMTTRTDRQTGHLYYKERDSALIPIDRLESELRAGLDDPSWIFEGIPADDGSDDSKKSSAKSKSSSTSGYSDSNSDSGSSSSSDSS